MKQKNKKFSVLFSSCFILLAVVITCGILKNFLNPKFTVVEYILEGKKYKLYLSDEQKKWQRGLMYIKNLKDVDGMLFVFPEKTHTVFYNKNTYLDLDVYWINGDSVVGRGFLPSIKWSKKIVYLYSPCEVDKVVELVKR
jgi:uncharacterized membrane protein (UPF0127 family)